MLRVLIAGLVGGVIVFFCGFVEHMLIGWGEPRGKLQDDAALRELIQSQKLEPELYFYPTMAKNPSAAEEAKQNERYKQGPSGLLLVMPSGDDPVSVGRLGFEALSNIVAAFIAAWILAQLMPGTSYFSRWRIVLLLGVFAWVSIDASYVIWYRFPWTFMRDQLFCALFEWGVAGLAIAAIVKPQPAAIP